ncbi:TPA: hypothetical protein N0F65_000588 [Lagenidium giganteum]|uniref:Cleft lip and palate associated transmembrane protein n=1 Tax=Lagenidium giganteum TaxID=4803 RepID=A0AAV2YD82_9STRA|nr:TPA: hypothetical protein N0F65_000588 [Lagenidium giganteum]
MTTSAANGNGNGNSPAGDNAEAPQTFLDRIMPYLRVFLMWYAFNSITGSFNQPATAPTTAPVITSDQHAHEPGDDAARGDAASATTAAVSQLKYHNAFSNGDALNLRVYLSPNEHFSFADVDAATEQEQLRWHVKGLTYSMATNVEREDGQWATQLNVTVDEHLLRNGSLFAHVFLTRDGYSPNPADDAFDPMASVHQSQQLNVFRPRPKIVKKRNLLEAAQEDDAAADADSKAAADAASTEEDAVQDTTFLSMWKPELIVNMVHDDTVYSSRVRPPPFMATHLVLDDETESYTPVLYLNDFWVLEEHLMPINATITTLPLSLTFYPLPLYKFAIYQQMAQNFENQEAAGTSTRKDTDGMKRLFIDTNPYLLAVTIAVSLLHSLFDFLAFKNDVSFWRKQKSLAGLSLRTVVLNTFFQLVIFLYLLDNDTSWMILVSSGVSLVIDVWKIKKALVVSRDENNNLVIAGDAGYTESATAEHDRVAVAHLSYVLYPLIVGHSAYTLVHGVHKGWYSWVISSLTSFVYMFGFIMMTPQLYINYKLKSVAHLPWRAMVYKSLNTFIDDLFAFVIKMPWMHRLSCFRDDLIFFIYLYQRWIYPVDASRTNEFGQEGTAEADADAAAIEGKAADGAAAPAIAAAVDATEEVEAKSPTEYLMTKPVEQQYAAAVQPSGRMLDFDSIIGIKEPSFDDDADVDVQRLPLKDREAIMARVTADDSSPPDAFTLAQNEIRREMIDRGIQPKGFYNDDAARLQEEFNREHAAEKESRMQQKVQFAAKSYLRETVHRRRMERERELREEVDEIALNPQVEVWLSLVNGNETPAHAQLRLSSIGTRALCKGLMFNHSLRSLSLSRNRLDDAAGKCLAIMLRRNTALRRLELESNAFGPATAKDLADALCTNQSLVHLNLESNPLTDDEKDFSGIHALANMLSQNKTLLALNLWRTRLGTEGGKQLALGMDKNDRVICLDFGNNRIGNNDAIKIDRKLADNRARFEAQQQRLLALRTAQLTAAEKEHKRQEDVARQAEYERWIDERKQERQRERERQEEERQRQVKLEEDRLRQLAARKAAEFAAKVEMEKKKKKKGGGKKKK